MTAIAETPARYVDEGLRVVLAEDWFIYVVRESDNLMFQYITEIWPEWGDVCVRCYLGEQAACSRKADVAPGSESDGGHTVADLIPYAHRYTPKPILSDSGVHMTLEKFLAEDYA